MENTGHPPQGTLTPESAAESLPLRIEAIKGVWHAYVESGLASANLSDVVQTSGALAVLRGRVEAAEQLSETGGSLDEILRDLDSVTEAVGRYAASVSAEPVGAEPRQQAFDKAQDALTKFFHKLSGIYVALNFIGGGR